MKARILSLLAVAALVLALGAVTVACGSDDNGGNGGKELTLEEYFQKLGQLDTEKDDRLADLEKKIDSATSEEDALKAIKEEFSSGVDANRDFVNGLSELNPPAEVKDVHEKSVDAGGRAIDGFEEVADKIGDAETMADVEAAVTDEFTAVADEFEQTCVDLQAIADEKGIETDLDCD